MDPGENTPRVLGRALAKFPVLDNWKRARVRGAQVQAGPAAWPALGDSRLLRARGWVSCPLPEAFATAYGKPARFSLREGIRKNARSNLWHAEKPGQYGKTALSARDHTREYFALRSLPKILSGGGAARFCRLCGSSRVLCCQSCDHRNSLAGRWPQHLAFCSKNEARNPFTGASSCGVDWLGPPGGDKRSVR